MTIRNFANKSLHRDQPGALKLPRHQAIASWKVSPIFDHPASQPMGALTLSNRRIIRIRDLHFQQIGRADKAAKHLPDHIKSQPCMMNNLGGISGEVILGDGASVLILDTISLAETD